MKLKPYWICQISGWGLATSYWVYWMIYNQYVSLFDGVVNTILTLSSSIFITHLYYLIAKRNNWHLLSIKSLLPKVVLAILLLAASFCIINILINHFNSNTCQDCDLWEAFEEARLRVFITGVRLMTIWVLAFHLYHYAQRGARAETEKAILETKAYEAQMEKLKVQLNPHFLFNSLNSVKAMILLDPEKARRAIVLLSDILRNSLNASQKEFVNLEDELQQVKDYLEIEKMRFEERLEIHFDIDAKSLQAKVLPLSLQILVENAIKHGINQRKIGGQVCIKAEILANELYLSVLNDGEFNLSQNLEKGLGLDNLRERLYLRFGKMANFEIAKVGSQQVKANIKMPLIYV